MALKSTAQALVAMVVCLSMLLLSRTAVADDPLGKPANPEARKHLAAGNKLYRVREFEQAVSEYKAGALLDPAPVFHYNLGQCYRQLGRREDAIWHYKQFLDRARPAGQLKDAVETFIRQLNEELDQQAGLRTSGNAAPAASPPTPNRTIAPATSAVARPAVEPGHPWYADALGWTLAGVGAVTVGAAIGLHVSAGGLDDRANREPAEMARSDLRDRAGARRTIGTIAGIAGGVVLLAGSVKLVLHSSTRTRAASLELGIGHDRVFVLGRF
jgi:tetratricopeptide (TPR) repeat protein